MKEELLKFHALLETTVDDLEYGTLSVNVILVNGIPKVNTLNIVASKRIKYPEERVIIGESAVIIDKRFNI